MKEESKLTAGNSRSKGRYMSGLDGLRALSVLAVIVYHLNSSWLPGGLLGVGVFFTLSGYLITDQLLVQWQTTRRIDLKDFWLKRVRRLMPAMLFMLAIVCLWLLIFDRSRLMQLQGDFVSVLLYFNNWWLIFHKVSYFESFGPPSPIGHLWSLAIEEQFYFIWPLVLALVLRYVHRRGTLFVLTLAGALVSMLVMAFVYQPDLDPSRVYYGTDTRAFALLIGGALAIVWPSRKLSEKMTGHSSKMLDMMGGAGLVVILLMMWTTNAYKASLYVGGLGLFSIITAIVIAAIAHPASLLGKVMGSKPLRWLGKRSYSLYIWHFPVIILTSSSMNTGGTDLSTVTVQILLSLLLAAFSYSCIEEPFRRGVFQPKQWILSLRSPLRVRYMLMIGILPIQLFVMSFSNNSFAEKLSANAAMIHQEATNVSLVPTDSLFVPSVGPKLVPSPSPAATSSQTIVPSPSVSSVPKVSLTPTPSPTIVPSPSPSSSPTATITPLPTPATKEPPNSQISLPVSDVSQETGKVSPDPKVDAEQSITAIGDSVILDAAPFLEKLLPGIVVDGKVGRQMSQLAAVIDDLKSKNQLGRRVIIELGTNGSFNPDQLRGVLTTLGDVKQIILVNTRVPRAWQDNVNATLSKVAAEFPQATVVDWHKASQGKEMYFVQDGVHLKTEGASYYASLLSDAVQKGGR
ncbi:hypothetical protein A8709_31185 [Paenibacillus pectinilyticus]|uniref:Acyltransferase 3 domain-containing protein n=2 Tax=Paenibacillus pectinilyticus TaxID=512399 RepID=A0A1C0ZXL5_9BACL|nr:hypothetical protein A8709_31185 [Paenibacillus pectinilyticus]